MIPSPHRDFLKGIVIPPPGSHTGTGCLVSQFWSFRKRLHGELLRGNSELAAGCQDSPVTVFPLRRWGIGRVDSIPEIVRGKVEQKRLLRKTQSYKSR